MPKRDARVGGRGLVPRGVMRRRKEGGLTETEARLNEEIRHKALWALREMFG
jgi:hypothetical protein